jgi:uncharacterized protein with ATP-grasp and redox domains
MRTHFDCAPCPIRQSLDAIRMQTSDEAAQQRLIREMLRGERDGPAAPELVGSSAGKGQPLE